MRKILLLGAIAVGAMLAASALQAGDVEAGFARAKAVCAECHVVATGVGRRVGRSGTDGAPPFATIVNGLKRSERQITTFLARPHGRMPDFILTRREIDDLTAYILSLRRR
ncbi:MAG TPA: c-type cytochrome [Alphaproteobacteria bacterium]|nr:c-type cytochrome [Alphaproteobacteria bacterium]